MAFSVPLTKHFMYLRIAPLKQRLLNSTVMGRQPLETLLKFIIKGNRERLFNFYLRNLKRELQKP